MLINSLSRKVSKRSFIATKRRFSVAEYQQSYGLLDLILVRHGESEGNVAYRKSAVGDNSLYIGEFLKRHSSKWRLTDTGRHQAASAGEWIVKNFPLSLDGFYSSEYVRAAETAARLNVPNAVWFHDVVC